MGNLDLLRFFAAASVLFYHYYFIGPLQGFWPKSLFVPLAHWGELGVDLFFVISGFVITLTSENRSAGAFLRARAVRLIPAFAVCSAITAVMAMMLPGINPAQLLVRWLASQTFYPRVFGIEPLSSVYWTLAIEVQFYGMVALLMAIGAWRRWNDLILWTWLIVAFVLQYDNGPGWLAQALITEYAGHFIAGIVLYRIHAGRPPRFAAAALLLACALISKHIQHTDEWLGGSYLQFFPTAGIILTAPFLLGFVLLAARAPALPLLPIRLAAMLGAMSYPFYLIHADLGFWSHAIFERTLFRLFPILTEYVTYPLMAVGAIVLSTVISWLVAVRIEPRLQQRMKAFLTRPQKLEDDHAGDNLQPSSVMPAAVHLIPSNAPTLSHPVGDASGRPLLSIVIPCFNEEEVIGETLRRLRAFCAERHDLDVELIFVDDGSRDRTRSLLKGFAAEDPRIKLVCFARNFGHQIAVTAGIDAARGDAVVLIDADLQDPPEVIHEMLRKWREGYDVVYGTRTERPGESRFKLATARGFYRLLNRLSDVPIPLDTGDFRLMSRKVVTTLQAMPERDRFVRGMVSWVGFNQTALPYRRAERFAGESKYPLRKMIRFATDGILSFSSKPLQLSVAMGMTCAGMAIAGIVYALILRLFTDIWVEGWTALMIAVLFIGGVQLISVGILGEYVGRIYNEIKGRPLYVVSEYIGFRDEGPATSRSPVVHSR